VPATWTYFDTSVLVKRYLHEEGARLARDLLRRYRFLSSSIAPVEALSAFSRRKAAGELSERSFDSIVSRMSADRAHWELIEISAPILERAEEVIRRAGVRTLDAIHIASALTFRESSGLRVPFVTADERQREAAQRMELMVTWVPS
jgi:predicted nucleic acid-binding protein